MSWQRLFAWVFLVFASATMVAAGCGQEFSAADDGVGGAAPSCSVPADCPGVDDACAQRECKNGSCGMDFAPSGASCEQNWRCDGEGNCVECVDGGQCDDGDICLDNACVPATCDNGSQDGDETDVDCGGSCPGCDNGGACGDGRDCASGYCPNGTCAACSQNNHCGDAQYCKEGICVSKKPNGDTCLVGQVCQSGFCPDQDGVCCDSPCDDTCTACLEGKTGQPNGTCALVTQGGDPDDECPASEVSSCGSNGEGCSGDGPACIVYPGGTECAPSVCSDDNAVNYTCDGDGVCGEAVEDCGAYACASGQCNSSCDDQADCKILCNTVDNQCLGCGGAVPLPPNNPPCPSGCNGGCNGNVCQIVCGDNLACANSIVCPPGMDCVVKCESPNACEGKTIVCNATNTCTADCSAPAADACRNLTMSCGAGNCAINCGSAPRACEGAQVQCGPNNCTANCTTTVDPPTLNCGESCDCSHASCY